MASVAFPKDSKTITTTDGTKYGYIKIEPKSSKPTLLFFHGYPSSSYHWHNQVKKCIEKGYGAIAPDLLGYGDTDKPTDIAAYDLTRVAKQVIDILDAEKIDQVVGVAHDWGCGALSTTLRLFPKRFSKLVFLSVGYAGSGERLIDIDALNAFTTQLMGRPLFGYWKFHNDPTCEGVIEKADMMCIATLLYPKDRTTWKENMCAYGGMESWLRGNKIGELAPWVKKEELETHDKILRSGGFTGPLNWYRQAMRGITHESELKINQDYANAKFDIPTLFVGTEGDMICIPAIQEAGMKDSFTKLTVKSLDTSHWCMIEQPEETWSLIEEFVEGKFNP